MAHGPLPLLLPRALLLCAVLLYMLLYALYGSLVLIPPSS